MPIASVRSMIQPPQRTSQPLAPRTPTQEELLEKVARLERERSLLLSVMEATDVMLVSLDSRFNFVWVNEAYAATCRKRPDELIGQNHFALYPDAENEAIFRQVRDTGEPVFYKDKPFSFPDQPERGVTSWDWSLTRTTGPDGAVGGLVFSLRETTRYKRAEEALRLSEERFRLALKNAPVSVAAQDRNLRFLWAYNQRTVNSTAVIGKTDTELFPPEDAARLMAMKRRAMEQEHEVREQLWLTSNGQRVFLDVCLEPTRDASGAITGIGIATVDLTAAKRLEEELREADRRKTEFLSALSHELRNPLTPIRNSLYILDRATPGGEQARRAYSVIDRQVSHLTRLVDDLLDVTRITRGKVRLQPSRLDLTALVRHTVDDHRTVLEGHELSLTLPDEPVWIDGDATRLAQALGNLLSNAAKFTPAGGRITVSLTLAPPRAVLEVADTGMGIDAETRARLFEPFAQADRSLDRSRGGLGLGLALVKGMVELHGGLVRASSEGPGRGATFILELPLASQTTSKASGVELQTTGARRRVLVIEDNHDAADSLAEVLELVGHQVAIAYDGRTGLAKARELQPDIVLCDLGLPDGLDGYAVARALREDPETASGVLIALSGYAQPEDQRRALEAGFDSHLAKPPELAELTRLLARTRRHR